MKEYSIIYRYIVHSSVAARGAAKARDSILPIFLRCALSSVLC